MVLKLLFSGFIVSTLVVDYYITFHRFFQATFVYGGSILGSSQFSLLSQLLLKTTLDLKVVKIDLKLIILLY